MKTEEMDDLYRRYKRSLLNYTINKYRKMFKRTCYEDAEDLLQDCFLSAWEHYVKQDSSFSSYMKKLIDNRFIDLHR